MRKLTPMLIALLLLVSVLMVGGCTEGGRSDNLPSEQEETPGDLQQFKGQSLNLFVAAGMKKAMDETIAAFEEKSGATVLVNYGPSGGLFVTATP